MDELKSCPHCKGTDITLVYCMAQFGRNPEAYQFVCDKCGLQSPRGATEANARDLWNGLPRDNKPNWKDAPDWANWLAQDENCLWCWFGKRPQPNINYQKWQPSLSIFDYENITPKIMSNPDWQQTLEKRPESV